MGSGEAEGSGVGNVASSTDASDAIETRETRLFRAARASFTLRLLGGDFLVGESGSSATLSGGLKIFGGSIDSVARVRLLGVVAGGAAVVLRLGDALVDFMGAGVNSSSVSSCVRLTIVFSTSEPSSSSTTNLRRAAAALREGLSGSTVDITAG